MVYPTTPWNGNPIYPTTGSQPYVSAGNDLAAITGNRGGGVNALTPPQGQAEFDGGRAFGNAVRGATVGFVGNTLNAIIQNPLLAAGAIGVGLAFPPLGIAMAGLGLVTCTKGVFDKFKQSRALADQADAIRKRDPYNMQQAAVLYRQAEDLYADMASDGMGALTTIIGLKGGANASATRGLRNGTLTKEQAAAVTQNKNWLGNWTSLKENVASVFRKSEWTESAGYRWSAEKLRSLQRFRSDSLDDMPEAASPTPSPRDADNPVADGDMADDVSVSGGSGRVPKGTRFEVANPDREFLARNPVAAQLRNALECKVLKFKKLLAKAEKQQFKNTRLNDQLGELGNEIYIGYREFKQAAAPNRLKAPDNPLFATGEKPPQTLLDTADFYMARMKEVGDRLKMMEDLADIRQQRPDLDRLLNNIQEFETSQGIKLQDNLGKADSPDRTVLAKTLQEESAQYARQLDNYAEISGIPDEAKVALQKKAQQLRTFGLRHQTVDDLIGVRASSETNPLNLSPTQDKPIDFQPLTPAQISQSPWQALRYELERLRTLRSILDDPSQWANMTEETATVTRNNILSEITRSQQQAQRIITQGLQHKLIDHNMDELKLALEIRKALDNGDIASVLDKPLPDALNTPATPDAPPGWQQPIENLRAHGQQLKDQAVNNVQTFAGDPSNRWKIWWAGNIAYGNRSWLAPTDTQPQQSMASPSGGMQTNPTAGQMPTLPTGSPGGQSNATNEAIGDYGNYVVLQLGMSRYRIYKAANANRISQERYDQLPLNERPYYKVDGAANTPASNAEASVASSAAPSKEPPWWQSK